MAANDTRSGGRPVVKTLLLTDFVDSTRFVSTLGDLRAAQVFAEHDHLTRQLLGRMGGQEIDKSDGFLFLFDRPIDSVRFAMAYHRLLRAISKDLPMPLEARTGIHLGEVVMRTNPTEDVKRGAKPVEVEGLAKATSARVMSAAAGGQTLLSESAYSLAARGAVGAEFEGEELRFVEHGAYALKGLSEPLRIFEVGLGKGATFRAPLGAVRPAGGPPEWVPWVISALALLALIGGVVWWTFVPHGPPVAAAPAPHATGTDTTAIEVDPPAEAVADPDQAGDSKATLKPVEAIVEAAATSLTLRIESQPVGALISYGSDQLGVAPTTLTVPAGEGSYPIGATLAGHLDAQTICRVLAADVTAGSAACRVILRPTPPSGRASRSRAARRPGASKKPAAKAAPSKKSAPATSPDKAQKQPQKKPQKEPEPRPAKKSKIHMID